MAPSSVLQPRRPLEEGEKRGELRGAFTTDRFLHYGGDPPADTVRRPVTVSLDPMQRRATLRGKVVCLTCPGPDNGGDQSRTMKRIMFLLLAVLSPVGLDGQDRDRPPKRGMVMEGGEWKAPTPATALRAVEMLTVEMLQVEETATNHIRASDAALAVLRQRYNTYTPAELGAFAGELVRLIREGNEAHVHTAYSILTRAAAEYDGEPERGVAYPGVVDALIGLYESYEDRLGREGDYALHAVFQAGGVDYVRNLYESSEQPPECQWPSQAAVEYPDGEWRFQTREELENPCPNVCLWCQAGRLLVIYTDDGPDEELWSRLCENMRY